MKGSLWITGVSGFSGRHLVAMLTAKVDRPRLVGLDRSDAGCPGLDSFHQVDLSDVSALETLARDERPSWVVHLGGVMPPATDAAMWHVNVGGTVSLLQALASAGCRDARIVSIGSAAEYAPQAGDSLDEESRCGGSSAYGRVKWAQSLLALQMGRELGLQTMVARPFNLIGPGLSRHLVAGWLAEQVLGCSGGSAEIVIGNLESKRDFIDIRDAVAAYWAMACRAVPGQVYNVCTGVATKIRTLLDLMCDIAGKSPVIRVDPARFRAGDVPVSVGNNGKLSRLTGWAPQVALRQSLADMLAIAPPSA